jgi:hypothetical protein
MLRLKLEKVFRDFILVFMPEKLHLIIKFYILWLLRKLSKRFFKLAKKSHTPLPRSFVFAVPGPGLIDIIAHDWDIHARTES